MEVLEFPMVYSDCWNTLAVKDKVRNRQGWKRQESTTEQYYKGFYVSMVQVSIECLTRVSIIQHSLLFCSLVSVVAPCYNSGE